MYLHRFCCGSLPSQVFTSEGDRILLNFNASAPSTGSTSPGFRFCFTFGELLSVCKQDFPDQWMSHTRDNATRQNAAVLVPVFQLKDVSQLMLQAPHPLSHPLPLLHQSLGAPLPHVSHALTLDRHHCFREGYEQWKTSHVADAFLGITYSHCY